VADKVKSELALGLSELNLIRFILGILDVNVVSNKSRKIQKMSYTCLQGGNE